MLRNEADDIVAFIDWEVAYIAPTQFCLNPPWWLLLKQPEMWDDEIDGWIRVYDSCLKTWLRAVKKAEQGTKASLEGIELSTYMRESWETGRFWLGYATRKAWAFDTIFWKYLNDRFFGKRKDRIAKGDLRKARVHLLGCGGIVHPAQIGRVE